MDGGENTETGEAKTNITHKLQTIKVKQELPPRHRTKIHELDKTRKCKWYTNNHRNLEHKPYLEY